MTGTLGHDATGFHAPDRADPTSELAKQIREVLRRVSGGAEPADLDGRVDMELARQCVIDWSAVLLAAYESPEYGALAGLGRSLGQAETSTGTSPAAGDTYEAGTATEFGRSRRVAASRAAGDNARHAHLLDFDDVHLAVPGHVGAPVVAAAWAVAEATGATIKTLLQGVVAGVEAMAWLGGATEPHHHARGWHPTATLGAVGAAVAAAVTLDANDEELRNAIGLAVLQASGMKKAFGSWGKAWQVGCAARNGVEAALAAFEGLTCGDMIGGPDGFIATYGGESERHDSSTADSPAAESATGAPSGPASSCGYVVPAIRELIFKLHAACFSTHSSIQAAAELRHELADETTISAARVIEQIADFEVRVGPRFASVIDRPRPKSGLEAKFSATGTVAMTLLGIPTVDPKVFTADLIHDPEYAELERRGTLVPDETIADNAALLVVRTKAGQRLSASAGPPSAPAISQESLSQQQRRVAQKFLALHASPASASHVKDYFILVQGPPDRPVRELAKALSRIRESRSHGI